MRVSCEDLEGEGHEFESLLGLALWVGDWNIGAQRSPHIISHVPIVVDSGGMAMLTGRT